MLSATASAALPVWCCGPLARLSQSLLRTPLLRLRRLLRPWQCDCGPSAASGGSGDEGGGCCGGVPSGGRTGLQRWGRLCSRSQRTGRWRRRSGSMSWRQSATSRSIGSRRRRLSCSRGRRRGGRTEDCAPRTGGSTGGRHSQAGISVEIKIRDKEEQVSSLIQK